MIPNIINIELLKQLGKEASMSPRLRTNMDLRDSDEDTSQRNLNMLQPGTIVPIHRHSDSSETVVLISGELKSIWYNEDGKIVEEIILSRESGNFGIVIPKGQWHSVEVLKQDTAFVETKNGKYEPMNQNDIKSNE